MERRELETAGTAHELQRDTHERQPPSSRIRRSVALAPKDLTSPQMERFFTKDDGGMVRDGLDASHCWL